jgi:hypothetical protein
VASSSRTERDPRIDFLRGVALLTIFIDHMPGNVLGTLTLRNFGFSDAAELFVLLSGFSSMLAYGRIFDRDGPRVGLRRVAGRCLRIYTFQIGLLLTTLAMVQLWISWFGLVPGKIRMLMHGAEGLSKALALQAMPSNLNILPLYVLLLAMFPLLYVGIRRRPGRTMLASAGIWLAANLDPSFNLTNLLDGGGWYFNPFAWQFLFAIGMLLAHGYTVHGRSIPRLEPLRAVSLAYLALVLLAAAPWTNWGFDWRVLDLDPDKTSLAPLRLINVLAFFYVLMCSPRFARLVRWSWLGFVDLCGRHSLEVFSVGTAFSLFGRLTFRTFGMNVETQLLVNGIGFASMILVAWLLERPRRARAREPARTAGIVPNR